MEPSYRPGGRVVKVRYYPRMPFRLFGAGRLVGCALSLPAAVAVAQSLPAYAPINPVAASRSGVYFQPYRAPHPGEWSAAISLDYASAIESNELPSATYLLDSELPRLRLDLARDLSRSLFVQASVEAGGAYSGFLDGFLDWYHRTLGIRIPERQRRPRNQFLYSLGLPDGTTVSRAPSDLFFGDVRLGLGIRPSSVLQSVVSITFPTSTHQAGFGRGVVSTSLLNTLRLPLHPQLVYEGSLSGGFTPSHGELAPFQKRWFAAGSSGLRFRFWGSQSLFANLLYHSPYYHDTTLPGLDRREVVLDFGWILATGGGREWRIGMTEDLEPGGPAVDLVFRLGVGR